MHSNKEIYVYANLILRGKGLIPEDVTKHFGINPSVSFKCGDQRNEEDKWKHNHWSLSSKNKIRSENLSDHIEWIIDKLEPINQKFMDIRNKEDVEAEISCFWIFQSSHEYLNISSELMKKINELNLKINIDFYCS